MRRIITLLVLLFIGNTIHAQGIQLNWVDGFYDENNRSEAHAIQIDDENNSYVLGNSPDLGSFLDIDPDADNVSELSSSGIFLAKFNSNGAYLWSVSLGNTGVFNNSLHGNLALSSNGDVLLVATLSGEVDFDPSNEELIISAPEGMIVLASYTSAGELNFVKSFPLSVTGITGTNAIDIDSQGNIFIGGFVMNNGLPIVEIDFNPGGSDGLLINDSVMTFFIAKFSSSGEFSLLKTMTGTSTNSTNRLTHLAVNSADEICITGEISGEWDMDPSAENYPLMAENRDIFIAKYTNNLELIFAKVIVSTGTEFSRKIALDAFDNMYVSGEFTGIVDFDPGEGETILTSEINREPYIAKFSPDGNLLFAIELNSDTAISATNATRSIVADKLGYIYIAGRFDRSCDFDPSENDYYLTPQNDLELYLAKYDEQGNFIWVIPYGSSSFSFNLDLAVNSQGVVTTCGIFRNNSDFNPGTDNSNTPGNSGNTMFIAQFNPCHYSSTSESICEGELYQASTRTFTESGIYQVSYLSTAGCDSIVTLTLNVNDLPENGVFIDGDFSLVCEQSDASYQWFNCETNELIDGEINQSFIPSQTGIYSVDVTLNGCTSSSECITTQIVSIENSTDVDFQIYPNPASDIINIHCDLGSTLELMDISGRIIFTQSANSTHTILHYLPAKGIYLLRITDLNQQQQSRKIIIQ